MTDSATGPRKKHRHDLGQEDHGPDSTVNTTRGIQILLGTFIAATGLLVVLIVYWVGRGA